jgi:hypothetical protein
MLEDDLLAVLDQVLGPLGSTPEDGASFMQPSLALLRSYARDVRVGRLPILGWAQNVVAVVRQPVDLSFSPSGYRTLLERVATVINDRYPPWPRGRGLSLGLTTLVLTPEPIAPDNEGTLQAGRSLPARFRAVPLGLFRLNLGQEAMASALAAGPAGAFREPVIIAETLASRLKRYVPLIESDREGAK